MGMIDALHAAITLHTLLYIRILGVMSCCMHYTGSDLGLNSR